MKQFTDEVNGYCGTCRCVWILLLVIGLFLCVVPGIAAASYDDAYLEKNTLIVSGYDLNGSIVSEQCMALEEAYVQDNPDAITVPGLTFPILNESDSRNLVGVEFVINPDGRTSTYLLKSDNIKYSRRNLDRVADNLGQWKNETWNRIKKTDYSSLKSENNGEPPILADVSQSAEFVPYGKIQTVNTYYYDTQSDSNYVFYFGKLVVESIPGTVLIKDDQRYKSYCTVQNTAQNDWTYPTWSIYTAMPYTAESDKRSPKTSSGEKTITVTVSTNSFALSYPVTFSDMTVNDITPDSLKPKWSLGYQYQSTPSKDTFVMKYLSVTRANKAELSKDKMYVLGGFHIDAVKGFRLTGGEWTSGPLSTEPHTSEAGVAYVPYK